MFRIRNHYKGGDWVEQEKLRKILQLMEGISYIEWLKLKHIVDVHFDREAAKQNNKIMLTATEELMTSYNRLF